MVVNWNLVDGSIYAPDLNRKAVGFLSLDVLGEPAIERPPQCAIPRARPLAQDDDLCRIGLAQVAGGAGARQTLHVDCALRDVAIANLRTWAGRDYQFMGGCATESSGKVRTFAPTGLPSFPGYCELSPGGDRASREVQDPNAGINASQGVAPCPVKKKEGRSPPFSQLRDLPSDTLLIPSRRAT